MAMLKSSGKFTEYEDEIRFLKQEIERYKISTRENESKIEEYKDKTVNQKLL